MPVELRSVGHDADRIVVKRHLALLELDHHGGAGGVVDHIVERRDGTAQDGQRL